jgi:hypothetical protein
MTFYVFTTVKIHIVGFWVVKPCSLVCDHQRFGEICRLRFNPKMKAIISSEMYQTARYRSLKVHSIKPVSYLMSVCSVSRVGVTYKTGFWLDDWIYCNLYIHITRDYRHVQRYRYSAHITHCQRIYQSHWHFKSHMDLSLHRLIPFLPFFSQSPSTSISRTRPISRLQLTVLLDYSVSTLQAKSKSKSHCDWRSVNQ